MLKCMHFLNLHIMSLLKWIFPKTHIWERSLPQILVWPFASLPQWLTSYYLGIISSLVYLLASDYFIFLYLHKNGFIISFFFANIFHLQWNIQDSFLLLWKSRLSCFKCLTKTWLFQCKFFSFSVIVPIFQHPIRTVWFSHVIVKYIAFIQKRAGKILGKVVQFIHHSRAGSAVDIVDPGLFNFS